MPDSLKGPLINFFQGRYDEDIFKTFYRVNSEAAISKASSSVGFKIKFIRFMVDSAQFIIVPPLLVLELFWMKLLMLSKFRNFRTNIIVGLEANK